MDPGSFLTFLQENPIWQYYISVMLVMAPAVRIFRRAGLPAWPALLLLAPWIGHLLCIAFLAFKRWPTLPAKVAKP
jgi:hypothetical protein